MSTWCLVAPVQYSYRACPLEVPIDLAHGVRLVLLPDWVKSPQVLEGLGERTRQQVEHSSEFAFYLDYEADALDERCSRAEELVELANLSLWIARPTTLRFNLFVHSNQPGEPGAVRHRAVVTQLSFHPWHEENELTSDDLAAGGILHAALCGITRNGTVWTAARAVWAGLHQQDMWELRVALLWMAMEALYGPDDPREVTHQLCERMALFLGNDEDDARQLYVLAKKGYNSRSRIIHGLHVSNLSEDTIRSLGCGIEYLVQRSFRRVLSAEDIVDAFDGRGRDKCLSDLIFSRRQFKLP